MAFLSSNNPFLNSGPSIPKPIEVENTGQSEIPADYEDPDHPHNGHVEAQIGKSDRKWTRKKITWTVVGIIVFLIILGVAVFVGIKVSHRGASMPTASNATSTIAPTEQHTITRTVTQVSKTSASSPTPTDDNSGKLDDISNCKVGIYGMETSCETLCDVSDNKEKHCAEYRGLWKCMAC